MAMTKDLQGSELGWLSLGREGLTCSPLRLCPQHKVGSVSCDNEGEVARDGSMLNLSSSKK